MNEVILNTAIKALKTATGYTLKAKKGNNRADTILQLDGEGIEFIAEVKTELRNIHVQQILAAKKKNEQILVVAEYIPQPQKHMLKEYGINYLDTAGNCYIKAGGLFVYINDAKAVKPTKPKTGTLWTVTGIKFLFAVLRDETLLNKPYRDIAAAAGVALGNVGNMLQQLEEEGYIKKDKQGEATLTNKDKLIEKWAVMYETKLRPKLVVGRYRFVDEKNWGNMNFTRKPDGTIVTYVEKGTKNIIAQGVDKIIWGGEVAVALMTGYLKPERITIYTALPIGKAITQLRAVPDDLGNIEILKSFFPVPEAKENQGLLTPPLLTYADLIATFDSRNHEAAKRIKQQYLDQ